MAQDNEHGTVAFNVRLPTRLLDLLDEMRRMEKDIPNRSEMARRCIEQQAEKLAKKRA